ncbi:MAG: ATP-dependent DNA helicase [Halieaceae bacterium]|jgi:DNA excision repair protein ERCC-2|nr:ATP-dependent DNA helicase [Halieaceae bacterium]
MSEQIVSVRELALFCHRSGDIDHRFTLSPTGVQGVEGHQRLYRNRPDSYCSEYSVEHCHTHNGQSILLRGRADGYDSAQGMVEEIKTCRVPAESIPESVSELHLAQARFYAAIIAAQEGRAQMEVRLSWLNIDSDEEWSETRVYEIDELLAFLEQSLQGFSNWLQVVAQLRQQRDAHLAKMEFPYRDYRDGQRNIAELVYKCVDQAGQLLIEAPTGIGKTAAVIFPALKALATDKHDRVIYLTAKSVGRRAAEAALKLFSGTGYCGSVLSLTAREKICLSPGKACHGDDCLYARGYYDKLPKAMFCAIEAPTLQREDIEDLARRFVVCPYQLALDLLPWVDVVIADFHYVYSLTATLMGLVDNDTKRWTVLLDEAHNLPSRARHMFSAGLVKQDLMRAKKMAPKAVAASLARINRILLKLQKETWQDREYHSKDDLPDNLQEALRNFVAVVGEQMALETNFLQRIPLLLDFYFEVLQFLRVAENWGDEFRFELSRTQVKQSLRLTLNCLDPGRLLAEKQERLHSVTAFSATLSPAHWIQTALGLNTEAVYRRLNSPFTIEQMEISIASHVDTRFKQRAESLPLLVALLQEWLQQAQGNCIVYFPSYRYLQDCMGKLQEFNLHELGRTVWVQDRRQGDIAREELLQLLEQRRNVAAFCILGGVFGEGIDLPGERLASVVIVGVGLPQVNRDTEQLRAYFEDRYGRGFDYAYLYPGMQKVDQALGRVIRGRDDRGRALLIDSRYSSREYRQLLPPWWTYRIY